MGEEPNPFEPPRARNVAEDAWGGILPYRRFDLISPLSPAEALNAVKSAIEPVPWFRFFWTTPRVPFEGDVVGNSFRCQRVVVGRSGFLPKIRGAVEPHSLGGSRIRGTMALDWSEAMSVVVIIALFGFLAFEAIMSSSRGFELLIPFVALAVLLAAFATLSFRKEATRARSLLVYRLRARPARGDEIGLGEPH